MNITLSPELEQFVRRQLESGKYASAEEVVLAGMRLLEEREQLYKGRFEELQQEIKIGLEEAERGEVIDSDVVFQALKDKLQRRRSQADS